VLDFVRSQDQISLPGDAPSVNPSGNLNYDDSDYFNELIISHRENDYPSYGVSRIEYDEEDDYDFVPNDDSLIINEGSDEENLSRANYECDYEEELEIYLSQSAFNLIYDYISLGRFDSALEIYETMAELDYNQSQTVAVDTVHAANYLISNAALFGKKTIVMDTFNTLKKLPNSIVVNKEKCLAALSILNFTTNKKLAIVQEVYDFIKAMEPKEAFGSYLSQAALVMLQLLVEAKKYDEALEMYYFMDTMGSSNKIFERRARAGTFLMEAYETMGWVNEAKRLYENISSLRKTKKVYRHRKRAMKILSRLLKKSGLIESAKQLLSEAEDTVKFEDASQNEDDE
jgi:tetratricopeptide (TPR) repeat protein